MDTQIWKNFWRSFLISKFLGAIEHVSGRVLTKIQFVSTYFASQLRGGGGVAPRPPRREVKKCPFENGQKMTETSETKRNLTVTSKLKLGGGQVVAGDTLSRRSDNNEVTEVSTDDTGESSRVVTVVSVRHMVSKGCRVVVSRGVGEEVSSGRTQWRGSLCIPHRNRYPYRPP